MLVVSASELQSELWGFKEQSQGNFDEAKCCN